MNTTLLAIRSEVPSVDPSQVPLWVSGVTLDRYSQTAIITLLFYDALTTMDKEVRYFWKTPVNSVNLVYFVNRYFGLLGAIVRIFWYSYSADIALCNFAEWTRNISNWNTVTLIDYILMIRVLALYSHESVLSACLKIVLSLIAAMKLGILIYGTISEHIVVASLAKGTIVCGVDGILPFHWALVNWLMVATYGVALMVLALYKAAEYWRLSAGFKGFELVKVLVSDQLIYFFFIIACSVINIVQFRIQLADNLLVYLFIALGNPSFLCILGSRMLINLKQAAEEGINEGISYRTHSSTVTEMEFA